MHLKKNLKFNLEKKRNSLLFTGLACAMAFTLAAFEWTTFSPKSNMSTDLSIDHLDDEQIVAITLPKKAVTPPPPAQKPVLDEFEIDDKPEVDETEEPDLVFPDEIDSGEDIHEIGNEDEIIEEEVIPHYLVEIEPEFIGGEEALKTYLGKKIKMPKIAIDAGVNARVFVQFTIDEEGNVVDVTLLNSIGYGCDEIALKAIQEMPQWKPGVQQNRNVKVRMKMPIRFKVSKM